MGAPLERWVFVFNHETDCVLFPDFIAFVFFVVCSVCQVGTTGVLEQRSLRFHNPFNQCGRCKRRPYDRVAEPNLRGAAQALALPLVLTPLEPN